MSMNTLPALNKFLNTVKERTQDLDHVFDRDIVILHSVASATSAENYDVPTILILHGGIRQHSFFFEENIDSTSDTHEYFAKREISDIRETISEILEKPDLVISNSKFIRKQTLKYYGIDSEVIYPPIDMEKFKPKEYSDDYYLSVQRMVWSKRPEVQIEAFKDLDEKLIMVGKGKYGESVRRETEKYENIEYKGYVSDEELVRLYSGANATIQTAIKEDFGYVPREGMACGTPAIVPNEGGFKELFEEKSIGEKFSPRNRKKALKQTVNNFEPNKYNEKYLRNTIKKRCSMEKIRRDFENAFRKVV